jgi:hypothetical protein
MDTYTNDTHTSHNVKQFRGAGAIFVEGQISTSLCQCTLLDYPPIIRTFRKKVEKYRVGSEDEGVNSEDSYSARISIVGAKSAKE